MTDCDGRWGLPRQIPETDITVQKCSGCGELLAIDVWGLVGTYPKGTSDLDIVKDYLEKRNTRRPGAL